MDSATYGSMDGVTCPPTSAMGYPAFLDANSGLTSFSVLVSKDMIFENFVCPNGVIKKLSVKYRCQTPTGR